MKQSLVLCGSLASLLFLGLSAASGQTASGTIRSFEEHCATCHRNPGVARAAGAEQAPDLDALRTLAPETVYASMTTNPTPAHARASAAVADLVRRGYAELVAGRKPGS